MVVLVDGIILRLLQGLFGKTENMVDALDSLKGTYVTRREQWFTETFIKWHYLLTYSMVQSPSWEANRFAASQEIPRISQNPKIH